MKNQAPLSLTAIAASVAVLLSSNVMAEDDIQDMSDPLAVFTQAGVGYTDKGINLKIGQTYDTGSDTTMGMNIIEVKGIAGEAVGWNGRGADDSIDSLRYRNFGVDLTNGRGSQVDVNLGFDGPRGTQGSASYSFIQALPKMGPVNLYPLAGMGVAFGDSFDTDNSGALQAQDRWDIHGTFYVAGLYSKVEITDKIWLNYNPMYMGSVSGSDDYKANAFGIDSGEILLHEAAISYQINPRSNVRYFANWNENNRYQTGDHKIEYNYQF
ncbi:hypothetical protein [Vibrio kyushuensis]|uniref:hypothetical protein n=1 Tax=Vibrio kyushuensis TaxID=2910249 RepID=UPI003D0F5167